MCKPGMRCVVLVGDDELALYTRRATGTGGRKGGGGGERAGAGARAEVE